MAPPPVPTARRALALVLAVGAVDAVLLLGFGTDSRFTAWWSSVGLGVAAVALTRPRAWALVALGLVAVGTAVRLGFGFDLDQALEVAGAHAAQAVVGGAIVSRLGRVPGRLTTQHDLAALLLAAGACAVASLAEPFLRHHPDATDPRLLAEVATQHAVSTVLLCAVVLLRHRIRVRSEELPELAVQLVLLAATTVAVFAPDQTTPLMFAPLPMLVWAALRFDSGVAAAELVGFAVVVTFATSQDAGPIAGAGLDEHGAGALVMAYVFSAAVITLPLALTVRHRISLLAQVTADEHLFRSSFTESPMGMVLLHEEDGELVVDELNTAATTILGVSRERIAGQRLSELVDTLGPHDRGPLELLDGAESWHGHAAAVERPGSRLEVALAALAWRDGSRVYSAQLLDVTQEHDKSRRLDDAQRLTDATFDTTAAIIMVADSNGTVIRVNAATRDITGFDDADLVGRQLWDTPLAPISRPEAEAMFLWPNRSGYAMVSERLGRTADREPLRIVWNNNVVRDELGLPSYAVLTGIDVTAERSSTGLMSHLMSASIATALIGVDGVGQITLFNAGAAHMLGWATDDMVGRPFVDLFDRPQLLTRTGAVGDHDAFHSLVGTIGDRDESVARDWTWRTRRGTELIVSMTLSVTEDLGEGRVGFLCVGRDVTEQREAQETVVEALEKERTAVERLRSLDRAKDEFVSTVSHELRTPVTSIIGYTEMLRDGSIVDPSPDQLPLLDTIARNSERLVAICNDLLMLSGFDSDTTVGVRTRIDLRDCITSAHESLPARAPEADVEIRVERGTSPVEVTGDRGQLDRLVANLLGNAVKFTPPGGYVEVKLEHDAQRAVLTVRDTGIGIPHDDHDAIFQRFYRSEEAQARAIPGTGLGLSIVAAIVKAHEGRIGLESEPGRGTIFRVVLPLTDATMPIAGPAHSRPG